MTTENPAPANTSNPWRRALRTSIAALLVEAGYQCAENLAMETLIEMTQAYIWEAGRSASSFAELAGRTHVMPSDVVLALVEMGLDFTAIPNYAKRENKTVFLPPAQTAITATSKILQVGEKKKHPTHIPDHLPSFPDPHTYIKTPCYKQPANEYQLVREKAATQKRDVEVALTRFIAKTGPTHSLFRDDKSAFPLIACKPTPLPYLSALLPMDIEASSQDSSDLVPNQKLHHASNQIGINDIGGSETAADSDTIDNPYLIPAKIAKIKWR
ncbi:transcription initiation factor TFIID subunit 8 [Biomphalaria pfeifferi]|uniref:Transcription initiation factor TFIID subunit 8 n=1 Tax=Biomphalaria pfeifferi TaxID=112525 RepID=A0AAD8BCU7_BIOPF|nr:transcription initiation factor TFIID subunit 8 [Biomphalaria pfeifferi]